jgi:hypothetical protein
MMRILLVRVRDCIAEVLQNSLATIGGYYRNVNKLLRGTGWHYLQSAKALTVR